MNEIYGTEIRFSEMKVHRRFADELGFCDGLAQEFVHAVTELQGAMKRSGLRLQAIEISQEDR